MNEPPRNPGWNDQNSVGINIISPINQNLQLKSPSLEQSSGNFNGISGLHQIFSRFFPSFFPRANIHNVQFSNLLSLKWGKVLMTACVSLLFREVCLKKLPWRARRWLMKNASSDVHLTLPHLTPPRLVTSVIFYRSVVTLFSLPCQPVRITLFSDVCLRLRALNSRVDAHNEARPPLITSDIRNFHNLFHASVPPLPPSPARSRAPSPRPDALGFVQDKAYSLELSVGEAAYIGAH